MPSLSHEQAARDQREALRRARNLGIAILGLVATGTVLNSLLEDQSLWYSLRLTFDTIATVGSLPAQSTTGGQILRIVMIVLGVGTLFYGLVTATEFLVTGRLSGMRAQRIMLKQIDNLQNHMIICGFGRVGQRAARELLAAGVEVLVVDPDPEIPDRAGSLGVPFIVARASDEDVLRSARIANASALLACSDSDPENVFITLAARELAPDLAIVARAGGSFAKSKLSRAGADHVVSPYHASGEQMARQALSPHVFDSSEMDGLRVEEIEVLESCPALNSKVSDLIDPADSQATVVAVQRAGEFSLHPNGWVVELGDILVVAGTDTGLDRLERALAPTEGSQLAWRRRRKSKSPA